MPPTLQTYRFTVDDYYRMAEAGILSSEQRVELLDGQIIVMTPIGRRHAACVDRLNAHFARALNDRVVIRIQNPVRLDEHSEPEPDVALLKPREDFYAEKEPSAEDALLIIEVADTSLDKDQQVKLPLYARADVPEVWIVDLATMDVHVHREPADGKYQRVCTVRGADRISPAAFEDVQFHVDELIGS